MKTKLEELKAAYEAATPGEWWEDDDGFVAAGQGDSYRTVADARCDVAPFSDANTEFIALAHNLMPTLLEAIDLLETVGSARACQDHEFDVDAWFKQVRSLLCNLLCNLK